MQNNDENTVKGSFECRSRFGNLFWIPFVSIILVFAVIISIFAVTGLRTLALLFGTVCIGFVALFALVGFYTRYTFESDKLIVRCPVAFNEPPVIYASVRRVVYPDRSWSYHSSLSTHCIGIHYGKNNYVSVSPPETNRVLEFLRAKCPEAEFECDGS